VNRLTAHGRTTPSEDVILGTGHLWQNGECVAAVHYLLVGSASPDDLTGATPIGSLMGVVRFADGDSALADALLHSGDLALQLKDGRHLPCHVQETLRSTPRRWMVTLTTLH